ncbi:hypothetical protein DYB32_008433 [Aphanomyces invadans]|uniref:Protein kinase domain-containing protein n=1 Tax=Aphanomyces invadans TaxID=157072 RepID=A0A3R6VS48_9STRA|nr:hypothetical protein DYB32_008433 [Aphanomyces invadans]
MDIYARPPTTDIGYKLPIPTIMEPVTGQLVQIVHSNIHACKYSSASVCDAFVDAEIVRDHTPNQPGNFTPGTSEATFVYSDLAFPTSGDMYVLAHLALPGPNATFRYDFAAYRRISILAAVAPPTAATLAPLPTQDVDNHSVVYIVAIGGGVLVVIVIAALLIYRHKHPRYYPPYPPHHLQSPYPVNSTGGYSPLDGVLGRSNDTKSTRGGRRPTNTGTADTTHSSTGAPWLYSSGGGAVDTSSVPGGGSTFGNAFSTGSATGISRADEETLQLWRLDENQVVARHMLSRGAFGEVWKGEYRGTPVAVKKLLASQSSPDAMKTFVAEILLMAKLDSKLIVKFIGVAWFRKAEMMLVLEYMDQGDLRSKLESTTPATFPLEDKLDCALSVAEGLVYLHTLDTTIIHRDIKSRNVLLDSQKGTKLTDFGVSRESTSETMTIGIGTYRWMAPEILSESHYTYVFYGRSCWQAADIYSLGVILSELDMHIVPYSDQVTAKGNPLNDTAIMGRVMQGTIQPTFSTRFPPALLELAKECLALDPVDRPTALAVAYRLGRIRRLHRQESASGIV